MWVWVAAEEVLAAKMRPSKWKCMRGKESGKTLTEKSREIGDETAAPAFA